MARNMYGATSADFTLTSGGRVIPGAVLTLWTARTGGTQITDLLDVDSVACTTVTSAADGSVVYYGPNNDKTVHWADSGQGSRIAIRPTDITGDPPVMSIGTVGTGAAAASLTGTSEAPVLNLTLPTAGANGVDTAAIQDSAVTSAKIADGTIVNADINASAAIALSKLGAGALTGISSITDQTMATATLGTELGDGANLTQALSGLTIGQTYQVAAVSGTLTAATLDGAPLTCTSNASSFVATATSHTVVGTAGTATAISVKLVTARSVTVAALVAGARVSQNNGNTFVGTLPTNLTTGSYNNALGYAAQYALTTGSYNNAVGRFAQYALTTGSYNSAFGRNAQYALSTGSYNDAFGASAQAALTTGSNNCGLGNNAQYALTTGSYNSAVGANAGRAVTTGSYNLALGVNAGYSGTTATISGSVCIGTNSSGVGAQATDDNQIVLGTSAHNTLIAGSLEMTGSGTGIIVRSPDGTRYRLGVANGGTVSVAAV